MSMIRCIAVDDEPLALKQIMSYIGRIPYFEAVAACASASQARTILEEEQVDVMFLDINMPDQSGMDFLKTLVNPPMVVFTTAYSEYAVEGYKVDAVDYMLKPFGFTDFERVAGKVRRIFEQRNTVSSVSGLQQDDTIFFKTDYKVVRVQVNKIAYVEGMSEYLKIHMDGQKSPVVVLLSMKKLEERLPSDKFMRVHKSFIINLNMIKEVARGRILIGETSIPIGDMYKESFNAFIDSKFMGR